MKKFNERLEALMNEKKYNNSSLSRKLNKVPSTVKKWVDGDGMPELPIFYQLANLLGVKPSYLLFGDEEQPLILEEPKAKYGIPKEDLIEFYEWKAKEALRKAEMLKQMESNEDKLESEPAQTAYQTKGQIEK
jgi:transcriptional regulator with XRE-family HTH domain